MKSMSLLEKLRIRRIGLATLSAFMTVSVLPSNFITVTVQADTVNGYTELTGASVESMEGNIVTIAYAGGEKAQIKFLRDNMFRFDMEPSGKKEDFKEYPTPRSTSHKATMVAQSDNDTEMYTHPDAVVTSNDTGNEITISTGANKVALVIDKTTAKMKMVNVEKGTTVWEESAPLKYSNKETIQTLATDEDEYIYGGGVQHGRFSHKGTTLNIAAGGWDDGGSSSPSPFYWSTNGYGIMRNTWQTGTYDFGNQSDDKIITTHNEKRFDSYFFVDDSPIDLIDDYTDLTGKAMQLPEYAFYLGNLDCYNRDYWDTTRNSAAAIKNERTATNGSGNRYVYGDATQYFERIPAKWEGTGLATQGSYILEKIKATETQETLLSTDENQKFSAQNKITEHENADMPIGYFLPNDGYGCGYGQTDSFQGDLDNLKGFTDYANAHGIQTGLWTQSNLWPADKNNPLKGERDVTKEVNYAGVRTIKTDVAWVGSGYSMALNGISVAYDAITESGARPNIITLMGWAGTQRYGGIWTGDQSGGVWEYIRFHIPTYIGSGLSGQPNVTSDMDGIYSGGSSIITTRDYQWKSFTPQMLDMDGWGNKQKNPWVDKGTDTSINRAYLKLKAELMPYINTIAYEASTTSNPMMRAMMLEYPNDMTYNKFTQYQYLWGSNFLVAPIYENTSSDAAGNDIRNGIYLPSKDGENTVWIDYFTGKQYNGGQTVNNFDAPLWKLPLFVKNGSIIPMYTENNNPSLKTTDNEKGLDKTERVVEFYPYGSTSFDAYEDNGMSTDNVAEHTNTMYTSVVEGEKATLTAKATTGTYSAYDDEHPSFDATKERSTTFVVNVSKAPSNVTGSVGGEQVAFSKVESKEAYEEAEGNVYFYDVNPESVVNKYADDGVKFDVQQTPKLYVKSSAKVDVSANDFQVVVDGFENDGDLPVIGENEKLAAPTLSDENITVTPETISLDWEAVEGADTYDVSFDGIVYSMNKDTSYLAKKLKPDTEYVIKVRAVNGDGYSKWSNERVVRTALDPLRNVPKNMSVTYLDGSVPAAYTGKLENIIDGDEKSEYSSVAANAWVGKSFVIDMQKIFTIDKLEYLFRAQGTNGVVKNFGLSYSIDGVNWIDMENWDNSKYASCPTSESGAIKTATLNLSEAVSARYIRFKVNESMGGFLQAWEIRPYHADGETGRLLGDIDGNGILDDSDELAVRQHYVLPGKHAGDEHWSSVEQFKTDYNNNDIYDAYDLSMLMTQLAGGVKNKDGSVSGTMFAKPSKQSVKAGETFTVDLVGAGMQNVNAFDYELSFPKGDVDVNSFKIAGGDALDVMTSYSYAKDRTDTTTFYGVYTNVGEAKKVNANGVLSTVTLTANKDLDLSNIDVSYASIVSSGYASKNLDVITLNAEEANPENNSIKTKIDLANDTLYPKTFKDTDGKDAWQNGHGIDKLFDNGLVDGKSFDTDYNNAVTLPITFKADFNDGEGNSSKAKHISDIVMYTRIVNDSGSLIEADGPITPEGNYSGSAYSTTQNLSKAQVFLHTASERIDAGTYTFATGTKIQHITLPEKFQDVDAIRVEVVMLDCAGTNKKRLNIAEMQIYENDESLKANDVVFGEDTPTSIASGSKTDITVNVTPDTAINKFVNVTSNNIDALSVRRNVVDGKVVFELVAGNVTEDSVVTLTATTIDGIEKTFEITVTASTVTEDTTTAKEILNKAIVKTEGYVTGGKLDKLAPNVKAMIRARLAEAKAVYENDHATNEACMNAWLNLANALQYLDFVADKTDLETLINECSDIDTSEYVSGVEEFEAALEAAQEVFANENVLQESINTAYKNLEMARDGLTKGNIDKTALQNIVNKITETIGDGSKYKKDAAWDTFQTALTAANNVLNNAAATQTEINTALTNLTSAYVDIRLVPDEALLAKLQEFTTAIDHADLSLYQANDVTRILKARSAAAALLANPDDITAEAYEVLAPEMEAVLYILENGKVDAPVVPNEPEVPNKPADPETPAESETKVETPAETVNGTIKPGTTKTGDSTNVMGISAMLAAGAGALAILRKKNKKNKK